MSQPEIMKSEKCVRQHFYADVMFLLCYAGGEEDAGLEAHLGPSQIS